MEVTGLGGKPVKGDPNSEFIASYDFIYSD
jgi:hypothetical protein